MIDLITTAVHNGDDNRPISVAGVCLKHYDNINCIERIMTFRLPETSKAVAEIYSGIIGLAAIVPKHRTEVVRWCCSKYITVLLSTDVEVPPAYIELVNSLRDWLTKYNNIQIINNINAADCLKQVIADTFASNTDYDSDLVYKQL